MGKLRVFFAIALIVVLLPMNAFGRHKKGDVVQDPNHSNITRECVSDEVEESDRWLVHITGTLPVSGMHNGHPYVDLGLKVKWAACDLNATKPEQNGVRYGWAEVVSKKNCPERTACRTARKFTDQPSSAIHNTTPHASIGAASGARPPAKISICLSANANGKRLR